MENSIIFAIEIIGTIAFASSGAMLGIRKNLDIFGVVVLGLCVAVGGGIVRDIILGLTPPSAFRDPSYALTALVTAVLLFGIGSSLCVAKDTYLKFLRLDKPCVVNEDSHSQLLQARNATAQDVGIVFSYSGQTMEMIQCIKEMKAGGAPVIAVTRYYPSEVAQLADHVLYVAANESLFRNGAMSSRLSQLNVVDILYTAYASRNHEDTMRRLTKTHIYKPGDPEVLTQP